MGRLATVVAVTLVAGFAAAAPVWAQGGDVHTPPTVSAGAGPLRSGPTDHTVIAQISTPGPRSASYLWCRVRAGCDDVTLEEQEHLIEDFGSQELVYLHFDYLDLPEGAVFWVAIDVGLGDDGPSASFLFFQFVGPPGLPNFGAQLDDTSGAAPSAERDLEEWAA